ncbi:exonuclease SbcCD subunit D C-terminal domain-containing protein [Verrucomicrobiales bacterium]|nr:exonuclease SbcCD subunit D C-terminal domain-containing protein [Verrucomicrobiales bacterium]MDB4358614.1 exonuclease SbcCD subunit D C-terminal domain-containing protein [Verrucomicrobiales bacterium]
MEKNYRILHTADWHLGKLLNDQSRDTEHGLFLEWLLNAVKDQQIDAIIVAGDIFDTANPPQSALQRYYDFVSRLFAQGDCQLAIIAGNHDSAAQLEAPKGVLNSLKTHVVGFLPEDPKDRILLLPDSETPRAAIALIPFLRDRDLRVGKAGESAEEIRAQLADGISGRYAETASAIEEMKVDCPVIATGHLTVVGSETSDSERDIHIGGLGSVTPGHFSEAFDYVALGHLHRPQATDENGRVRYSGSPIALSFSESKDKKEVRILDLSEGSIEQTSLPIPVFRNLSQIRTKTADLEKSLSDFSEKAEELRSWVELIVEDALIEDNLTERVATLITDRDFDVLKVIRGKADSLVGMSVEDVTDDEAIESLLDKPALVFEHLLEQQEQLTNEEVDELKLAFSRLVELEANPEPIEA